MVKTLKLSDGELVYQMEGSGPSLLLIHAGIADSRMWDAQFDSLTERFQVVRSDLRGYGQSYLPNGPFAYHDDMKSVVENLGLSPAWIVAASFGAQVAIDFALTHPAHVKGLVLAAPAVGGFKPADDVAQFNEEEDALLEADKLAEATELNLRMWVDGPYRTPDLVDPTMRKQVGEMQLLAFSHPEPEKVSLNRLDPPAIERLHDVQQPTLIVSGTLDVPEFVRLSDLLAKRIPGAEKVVVPGVAHMISMEKPELFNRLASEFIFAQDGRG